MKKLVIASCALAALASVAFGGTETYSGKQTAVQPAPCPQWYRDTEWDVSLWGTYLFTGTSYRNDTYLGVDHAWGGGGDVKYFFHRYFGIGIEGYAESLGNNRSRSFVVGGETFDIEAGNQSVVGSVLGTFTFRYPIPCSRFAPYAFAGGVGSSVVAAVRSCCSTAKATSSPNGTTIPQPNPLGSLAAALKFASRRQSAGRTISAGMWSTGRRTTSGWSAAASPSPFS